MIGKPIKKELSNGIRYAWLPTGKFKTVSFRFFVKQELCHALATKTALLPKVLERGSKEFPDSISLRRKLENLYGADLSTGVGKAGECQVMEIALDMVDPRFTGDNKAMIEGLQTMKEMLFEPLVEDGGFRKAYLEQEKFQLGQEIQGLLNDKTAYAMERCIHKMCGNERYGVFHLGKVEDLESINKTDLYDYHTKLLKENPIDLYIVGMEDEAYIDKLVNEVFSFSRDYKPIEIPPTTVLATPEGEVATSSEEMSINQGKLVMGYRTGISYGHELFYPLVFFNGILGTFPHSKLFQNVREKASLAYFVFSRLEKHKGLMIVAAGIDVADYDQAVSIIGEQLEAACRGEITSEEMENTRVGLINHLRARTDSPSGIISFYYDNDIGGKNVTIEEVIENLNRITVDDVKEAACRVKLDTIYFLRGPEGGNQ